MGSYVMYKLRNTEETKNLRLNIAKEGPQGSHPSLLNKALFENSPINDALLRLAGCKAYENKPYPILLTLYGPISKPEKSGFHLSLYVL